MRNREQTPLMLSTKKRKKQKRQVHFGGIEGVRVEAGDKRWNWQREHGQSLGIKSSFDIKMIQEVVVYIWR